MARDYKSRPTEKKQGNSVWPGIMIGLLVGLAAAAAIAIWVGRSNPFAARESGNDKPAAEHQAKNNKSGSQVVDPLAKADAPGETDKPRFDFYKILPGTDAAATDQGTKPADAPTPKSDEQYYLQAGAFPRLSPSCFLGSFSKKINPLHYIVKVRAFPLPSCFFLILLTECSRML